MSDLNACSFTGRLVRDAVQKTLSSGTALTEFDLANNIGWGDNKKVMYITVNLWGKTGAAVYDYLNKGKAVAVTGTIELQKWTGTQDGLEHSKMVLNCNSITLLGSAEKQDNVQPTNPPASMRSNATGHTTDNAYDNEIPF